MHRVSALLAYPGGERAFPDVLLACTSHTVEIYIYCVYLLHVTPCALLVTPLSDTHAIHMARLTGKRSLQCEGCAESCVGAECCECKAPISERRRVHFSDMVSDGAVAGAETGAGL